MDKNLEKNYKFLKNQQMKVEREYVGLFDFFFENCQPIAFRDKNVENHQNI